MTFSTLPGQADALTCDMEGVPVDASNLVIKVDNGQQARSTKYTKSWSRRLVSLPQSVADVGWFPDTCLASLLLHANFFLMLLLLHTGPQPVSQTHWLRAVLPSPLRKKGATR